MRTCHTSATVEEADAVREEEPCLAASFMARAERELCAVTHELDGGYVENAGSSCYYAALYAAKVPLAMRGLQTNRHSAVIRLLGRQFVAPGLLHRRHGRPIGLLLHRRLSAAYDAEPDFTHEKAEEHLDQAREFVADASALLDDLLVEE